MADGTGGPIPRARRFEFPEAALILLGGGTTLALLATCHGLSTVLVEVQAATLLYAAFLLFCRGRWGRSGQSISWLGSYAFVVWFYCAVFRITPALGSPLRDPVLLALDEEMFGQTPAIFCETVATPWLTDLLSLCYLTYHLYLFVAVVHAVRVPNQAHQRLSNILFTGFAIGFAGYLLVPAVGPAAAFPALFHGALPGGTIWKFTGAIIEEGSSRYDVFPSLHILITCILLDHDWREFRRRFWLMIVPVLGLMVSTIYLRYHFGVDLLAGFLLFLALRACLKIRTGNAGLSA